MSIREAPLVFADAMIIFLGKQKGYPLIALHLDVWADPTLSF
jgi:hypothetical protein